MATTAFAALYTRDEHPAEFDTTTHGPYQAAVLTTNAIIPLRVFDRQTDIESISTRVTVASTAAATLTFAIVAPTAALTVSTAITAAELAQVANMPANTMRSIPLLATRLNVAAGSTLVLIVSATAVTDLTNLLICVRNQNRRYRVTDPRFDGDTGVKQFLDPPSY